MTNFGNDAKKIVNELIEEEFTSRAFDNVKAAIEMVSFVSKITKIILDYKDTRVS